MKNNIDQFASLLFNTKITISAKQSLLLEDGMNQIVHLLEIGREQNNTVYIIGNGGSAAIASHAVTDFSNMANIKALEMLNTSMITCRSNDYGYEYVYQRQLHQFVAKQDILIAISSSGQSKNIINGVDAARLNGAKIITLSGFNADNPLRQLGDYNIWLDSKDYGQVEIGHAFVLHQITDCLKNSAYYKTPSAEHQKHLENLELA